MLLLGRARRPGRPRLALRGRRGRLHVSLRRFLLYLRRPFTLTAAATAAARTLLLPLCCVAGGLRAGRDGLLLPELAVARLLLLLLRAASVALSLLLLLLLRRRRLLLRGRRSGGGRPSIAPVPLAAIASPPPVVLRSFRATLFPFAMTEFLAQSRGSFRFTFRADRVMAAVRAASPSLGIGALAG